MQDGPFPLVIFGLFLVGMIVAMVFAAKAAAKRREELAALASELGWAFQPGYHHPEPQHKAFAAFRRGHSERPFNTFRGTLDIAGRIYGCTMGDYEYKVTSGSGKSRRTSTYRFSYLIAKLPYTNLPTLQIRPENVLDKIAGAIGFDDIDFESEEFSRRYHVKSSDKRFAYDVVHPRMMEFLLANPGALELQHVWCCVTDGAGRWNPAEMKRRVQWFRAFVERLPEHLVRDLESRSPTLPSR